MILYSGFTDTLTSEEVMRYGVRALMTKPLEPDALFSVLSAHLPQTLPVTGS